MQLLKEMELLLHHQIYKFGKLTTDLIIQLLNKSASRAPLQLFDTSITQSYKFSTACHCAIYATIRKRARQPDFL